MSERPPQLLAPNGEPFNSETEAEEPRELIIPGEDYPEDGVDPKDFIVPGEQGSSENIEPKTLVSHDYYEPQNPHDLIDHNGQLINPENEPEVPELVIPGRREINPDAADTLILPGSPEFAKYGGGTSHNTYQDYNEAAGGEDRQEQAALQHRIDEADAMNRPTKRMRTLQAIAHEALDAGQLDLAIEAASRIRTSKVRKQRGLSQLWIRNTLAHDQVMRDIADRVDQPHLKLEVAEHIRFGYQRNPVMGAIIDSSYEKAGSVSEGIDEEHEGARGDIEKGWHLMGAANTENKARTLKQQIRDIRDEAGAMLQESDEEDAENEEDRKESRRAKLKEIARLDEEARKLQRKANEWFKHSDEEHERAEGWHLMGSASLEDEVRDLEQRAVELASEKLRGWGASKHFGEAVVRRALFKKDPAVLTALGGIRHLLRKRRAKKIFKEEAQT